MPSMPLSPTREKRKQENETSARKKSQRMNRKRKLYCMKREQRERERKGNRWMEKKKEVYGRSKRKRKERVSLQEEKGSASESSLSKKESLRVSLLYLLPLLDLKDRSWECIWQPPRFSHCWASVTWRGEKFLHLSLLCIFFFHCLRFFLSFMSPLFAETTGRNI